MDNLSGTCGRYLSFFPSLDVLSVSSKGDLGSPSQTSISMHLQPRSRALYVALVRSHMPEPELHATEMQGLAFHRKEAGRTFLYASVLDWL